jgi:hypothetical protein
MSELRAALELEIAALALVTSSVRSATKQSNEIPP